MPHFAEQHGPTVLALMCFAILCGSLITSSGLFAIDEYIYLAATDALAVKGGFTINNGYEQFGADSLKIWLLIAGPSGLVSQYPVGSSILGIPVYQLFGGARGLIVLNGLAAVATIYLTHIYSSYLYKDARVALVAPLILVFCSFFSEYAYGIWPHSVSVFFVVLALYCATRAIHEDVQSTRWALAAGVAVGMGFLIRSDTILIIPPMVLLAIWFAKRPWYFIVCGVIGIMPAILVASATNNYKFGTWNPLSYGREGGATDVSSHINVILVGMFVFCIVLGFRYLPIRKYLRFNSCVVGGFLLLVFVLVVPELRDLLIQYAVGFYALVFDVSSINDVRPGVVRTDEGVVYFWGMVKKGLGQSLPWMGLVAVLFVKRWRENRFSHSLFLVCFLLWTLPYALLSWHGGLGSNMRYFLPMVPLCSIVVSKLWFELVDQTGGLSKYVLPGILLSLIFVGVWNQVGPGGFAGVQQIMSTYLFVMIAGLAILFGLQNQFQKMLAHLTQAMVAGAFVISAIFAVSDLASAQERRSLLALASDALANLPRPNMILEIPEAQTFQIGRSDGIIVMRDRKTDAVDIAVLLEGLKEGYRVFVPRYIGDSLVNGINVLGLESTAYRYPLGEMVELKLRYNSDSEKVED